MHIGTHTAVPLLVLGILASLASPVPYAGEPAAPGEIAIIANSANKSPDPSFEDLGAILRLEKQFWSDGKRVVLLLPPSGSASKTVLLKKVYHRTDPQLRQDWARRLFAGEIPAVPTTLRSVEAQIAAVTQSAGAVSAVPAGTPLPPNVRIVAVDGKRPGEPGYRLSEDER
jgi:hypothetical protein